MIKISDAHWDRIRHHFPEEGIPDDRPGRKPVPARRVLDAVLWILTTGAQWHLLPQSYPNYKTVHRSFQAWARQDILRGILVDLANELRERDLLDTTECYIDATFANGRGGGLEIGNTKCGKGVKIMAIVDRAGLPLSVSTHAANHHEVKLVQLSFDFYMIEAMPDFLIGDRAYDSDGLDDDMRDKGVKLVSPHRRNRKKGEDPGWPRTEALQAALGGGTILRLDEAQAAATQPVGVPSVQFSRVCADFCRDITAETNLR